MTHNFGFFQSNYMTSQILHKFTFFPIYIKDPYMSLKKMSSDCYLALLGALGIITVQLVPLSNSVVLSDMYFL